jgi:hypothetical protein
LTKLIAPQTRRRIAGWLRNLPGSSAGFGPPRSSASLAACALREGSTPIVALPARPAPTPAIRVFGSDDFDPLRWRLPKLPPIQVASLHSARLLWPEFSVVTRDDTLVDDISFWGVTDSGALHRHPLGARWRAPQQRHLRGRTLSLATDFATGSFGHVLLDGLPRLNAVCNAGYHLADFDWIVLPRPIVSPTLDRVCAAAGLKDAKVISPSNAEDFICDELVVTTFPGAPGNYGPETVAFYRQILGAPRAGNRRLYLSRQTQGRRRLANGAEVDAAFAAAGFEIIAPESDGNILTKCAEAAVIAGVEGSNMAHQLFAPAGAAVIYFVDSKWRDLPYVPTLAAAAGHKCYCIVGDQPTAVVSQSERWKNAVDFRVDPQQIKEVLDTLPSHRAGLG